MLTDPDEANVPVHFIRDRNYAHDQSLCYVTGGGEKVHETVDLRGKGSRRLCVLLHGTLGRVVLQLPSLGQHEQSEQLESVSICCFEEMPAGIEKAFDKGRAQVDWQEAKKADESTSIESIRIKGEGRYASQKAIEVQLEQVPVDIQANATLLIDDTFANVRDRGQEERLALDYKAIAITGSRVATLSCSSTTAIEVHDARLDRCHIHGELAVGAGATADVSECSVKGARIAGALGVRGKSSFGHLRIESAGSVRLHRTDAPPHEAELVVQAADSNGIAVGRNVRIETVPMGSGATKQLVKLGVFGSLSEARIASVEVGETPTALVSAAEGALLDGCELSGIAVSFRPTSIAEQVTGDCWVASISRACLRSHRKPPLRINGLTSRSFPEAIDSPFDGAVVEGTYNALEAAAHPSLVALADCATFNPYVSHLPGVAKSGTGEERVGVELLNRAIVACATLGSVRTKSAYAAGIARSHLSASRSERCALKILSRFGFGQQPLRAFCWWIVAVCFSTILACWPYEMFDGLCYAWPSNWTVFETFIAMAVEPFNLLKASTDHSESPIPWTGYGLTIQRAILAIAFGHFVVAFARFTRVTFRPT